MTPANFIECQQGSQMWKELRCGMPTASRAADVIAMTKKGEGADRKNYRTEIICERLTGQPYPQSAEHARQVQWGKDQEPYARAAYELAHDVLVETVGFVIHPTVARFGASPDGLVGDDGMIQIKCPTTTKHLEWIQAGVVPVEHIPQMLAEMSCAGRKWCDFVSYDPRLTGDGEHLQLFVRRYHRDEKLIAALEAEVVHFNSEIDQVLSLLPQKPQGIVLAMDQVNDDEVQF